MLELVDEGGASPNEPSTEWLCERCHATQYDEYRYEWDYGVPPIPDAQCEWCGRLPHADQMRASWLRLQRLAMQAPHAAVQVRDVGAPVRAALDRSNGLSHKAAHSADAIANALAARISTVFPSGLDDDQWYSVAQVVELSGYAADAIRERIDSGDLPASKPKGSREWRIRRQDFRSWMSGARDDGEVDLDPEAVARKMLGH